MPLDTSKIKRPECHTIIPAKLGDYAEHIANQLDMFPPIATSKNRVFYLASLLENVYNLGYSDGKKKAIENLSKVVWKEVE